MTETWLQILAGASGVGFGIAVLVFTIPVAAAVAYGLGYGGKPAWWGGIILIPAGIVATIGGLGVRRGLLTIGSSLLHITRSPGTPPSTAWLVLQGICVVGPLCVLLFVVVPTWAQTLRQRALLQAELEASGSTDTPPADRSDHHEEQERR